MNQKIPTNCRMPKASAKPSWSTSGRACQISAGALNSASAGEVPMTLPTTTASSARRKRTLSAVEILYRVQSEKCRCDHRVKRPKTTSDQNLLYRALLVQIHRWIWRSTSRAASQSSHCCDHATWRCASTHVSAGENCRYSFHTSTSKITAKSSTYRVRSHQVTGLRVPLAFHGKRGSGAPAELPGRTASGVVSVT